MSKKIEKLEDLIPDSRNANQGTPRGNYMIHKSLSQLGAGRSIVVDKNGNVVAGNKTLEVAAELGLDIEVVQTDGKKLVVVQRQDFDLDDITGPARQYAIADNRSSEVSLHWDTDELLAGIEDGLALDDWFFDDELQELLTDDIVPPAEEETHDKKPSKRNLPLDLIFTYDGFRDAETLVALTCGWKYGVQSSKRTLSESFAPSFDVTFVDNDYFNYDHEIHVETVKKLTPKYATTRDIMTRQQCFEAEIDYYSLEQVLEHAKEIEQYAQNVIVIPKYDCLDQIPDHYVLGYSVPSSHGGTPLPAEMFKGRRVHLLGGSWKKQLHYLAVLGDDVVSVDNNYIIKIAQYGDFCDADGNTKNVSEGIERLYGGTTSHRVLAATLSFNFIAYKVNQLFSKEEYNE